MGGPFLRRTSSSRNGGWPLFCRLLLWATRNNRACESLPDAPAKAKRPRARQPAAGIAEGVPAGALLEAHAPSKA
jgi:hypothetical protein